MGIYFNPQHTNIVVYLATSAAETPRIARETLDEFLSSLPKNDLPSKDRTWVEKIRNLANETRDKLGKHASLDPLETEALLKDLRREFTQFELYAMLISAPGPDSESFIRGPSPGDYADQKLVRAAHALALQNRRVFVLIPYAGYVSTDVLDPLPACSVAMENKSRWPGLLYWTQRGTACFVPLSDIDNANRELTSALLEKGPVAVDSILQTWRGPSKARRIIHLSDLHFGREDTSENRAMLEAELHKAVKGIDRVVITGDLFNSPDPSAVNAFRSFRDSLERSTGKTDKSLIVIPGNHDQRKLGIVGQNFRHVADLNWSTIHVDDEISTIFLGFNSAQKGAIARGVIGREQLKRQGTLLLNAHVNDPSLKQYLHLALVHHHPCSYVTAAPKGWQKVLAQLGINSDTFLEMKDAQDFLKWCARWGVAVVLHGHKHVARCARLHFESEECPSCEIGIIGCGSSLGAEGTPLSYTILSWDFEVTRWSATFFESRQGGPFTPRLITVERIATSRESGLTSPAA